MSFWKGGESEGQRIASELKTDHCDKCNSRVLVCRAGTLTENERTASRMCSLIIGIPSFSEADEMRREERAIVTRYDEISRARFCCASNQCDDHRDTTHTSDMNGGTY